MSIREINITLAFLFSSFCFWSLNLQGQKTDKVLDQYILDIYIDKFNKLDNELYKWEYTEDDNHIPCPSGLLASPHRLRESACFNNIGSLCLPCICEINPARAFCRGLHLLYIHIY